MIKANISIKLIKLTVDAFQNVIRKSAARAIHICSWSRMQCEKKNELDEERMSHELKLCNFRRINCK